MKKLRFIIRSGIGLLLLALFLYWQNNDIVITKSRYVSSRIPKDFNNFDIAHISDLHNKSFGKNQSTILNKLNTLSPDIIVITGDLVDRRKYDLAPAMEFIEGAIKIAPIYYVSGNHEAWSGEYSTIKESLEDAGVKVLDNSKLGLSRGDSFIQLLGVRDPAFLTSKDSRFIDKSEIRGELKKWSLISDFKILLIHRPELFDIYAENKMDLIFAGHAHGGQIRLPIIGGVLAPNQGLFPKYTDGSHTKNSSTMFISRGLGNSIFPFRIGNRPEIVMVTLKTE
ncbi:MAG: metallophosphoesterase [Clostridiales bacterium]|nr:metallophosphoesterase [Clostridiales bacterium]